MYLTDFVIHPGFEKLKQELGKQEAGAMNEMIATGRKDDATLGEFRFHAGIIEGVQRAITLLQRMEKESRGS